MSLYKVNENDKMSCYYSDLYNTADTDTHRYTQICTDTQTHTQTHTYTHQLLGVHNLWTDHAKEILIVKPSLPWE